MDSLYNVIDKSITHSFNFDDIELVPVDAHPNVTASLRSTHNVEIPCDTLLSAVYNVKFLEVLDKPVYIDGTYPAWLSKNHDVFPEYYTKNILHPKLGIWHWTREDTELNGRGKVAVRGDLTLSHEASLKFAEFQYVSNMTPQTKKLNDDVLACVNAIISHVSRSPYNHDTQAFTNDELQLGHELKSNVFYGMWVSPDNGLIVVDHVSYYEKPIDNYTYPGGAFILTEPPTRYMDSGVVFTNLIVYKLGSDDNEVESQKYVDFSQRISEIAMVIEDKCHTHALQYNTTYKDIDRTGIKFDKNKHLFYSGASSQGITSNPPDSYEYCQDSLPWRANVVPLNCMGHDDIKHITNYCSNRKKSPWVKTVQHSKVIGFADPNNPYFMIYAVSDIEFGVKLLGEDARQYLKEKCVFYNSRDRGITYSKFYVFFWYTDTGMQLIERAYNENWTKARLKKELQ